MSVSSGTVNVQGTLTVNWLTNSGVVNFSQFGTVYPTNVLFAHAWVANTVMVAGVFTWSGGVFGSVGSSFTLLANGTMTLNGSGKSLGGGTVVNGGLGVWTAGQVNSTGGMFSNAPLATLDFQADGNAFTVGAGRPS